GEGGNCVYGTLMPAPDALRVGGLPIGLANQVKLKRGIAAGEFIRWTDVEVDEAYVAVRLRREMELVISPGRVETGK
ncbi:MAG: flagellar biosynthesis protein FlgA, partial [Candidatus Methylomirabilaceae bacterium]